jgi:hypothetical protein
LSETGVPKPVWWRRPNSLKKGEGVPYRGKGKNKHPRANYLKGCSFEIPRNLKGYNQME